eukprot:CAMPEP_0174745404 /NCGR_PEP_ID=MMETSP1094-20130205/86754_1 /TAXON_ID=156173 /ORGANISM="Chrysochromulina brevifilum, Strain UTEX LB 985" /LENGTH=53 /DNA_ID=CAMNT_0015949949 /DNA_START=275 /DNA_END=437 /DNA_ORIENTATION=-
MSTIVTMVESKQKEACVASTQRHEPGHGMMIVVMSAKTDDASAPYVWAAELEA